MESKNTEIYILAVDPGTTHSGVALIDTATLAVVAHKSDADNQDLVSAMNQGDEEICEFLGAKGGYIAMLIVEMITSYGMPVGRETFETLVWIGRFAEAFDPGHTILIPRREVKLYLCNSLKAKDANVRRAVLDRYPATGGGKTPQIGTKGQPGPLFGVKSHTFAAIALGLTYIHNAEKYNKQTVSGEPVFPPNRQI
jgi:hypothetical protein